MIPKFLEYLVILCFERWCSKQNTVACLKLKDLALPKIWAGYATGLYLNFSYVLRMKRVISSSVYIKQYT